MSNILSTKDALRVINASAGSGKTTQLVGRLIRILNTEVAPNKVCATTFTRKAAYEISSRLYKIIAERALGKENDLLTADTAARLLKSMTIEGTQPKIATIDSFFSEAARVFALELGLPPEWSIVPESESRELLAKLSDEIIQTGDRQLMGTLVRLVKNDRAVRSFHETLISEITKGISLWRLVKPEIRSEVWHWREQEAKKVRERQEILLDLSLAELPRNTDGKKINSHYENALNSLLATFSQLDPRVPLENGLVKAVLSGSNIFSKKEIPNPLLELLREVVDVIKFDLVQQLHFKSLALIALMSNFNDAYFLRVRELGLLSYDDLKLVLASGLAQDWSELLSIRLDSKFDHLLFDEFQDTSLLQWNYFQGFASEIMSSGQNDKSLFVVGDKKQSIYSWRGGVKQLFDEVTGQIVDAGGNVEAVATNYRSSPEVIALTNQVFQNLPDSELATTFRARTNCWLKDFQTHQAFNEKVPGEVKLYEVPEDKRINRVVELTEKLAANPDIQEIGILVRTNKELRLLAKIFDSRGISVSQEGGAPLENEPLCLVLVNLLNLLDHPGDTASALIVSSSIVGELLGYKDYLNPSSTLELTRRIRLQVEGDGLHASFSTLLLPLRSKLSARELTVLDEILELMLEKEFRTGPRLASLIPIIRKHKFERASAGKVRLLTAHSAKGLEFDVVILAELGGSMLGRERDYLVDRPDELKPPVRVVRYENEEIRSMFPELERISEAQKARSFEESLSVLYVSLTRAKRGLALFFGTNERRKERDSYQALLRQVITLPDISLDDGQTLFGKPGTIFPVGPLL